MKCNILFSTHFAGIYVYFPHLIPYQLKLLGSPFLVRKWHSLLTLLFSMSPSFSSSDSFEDLHVFEVENLVTFVLYFVTNDFETDLVWLEVLFTDCGLKWNLILGRVFTENLEERAVILLSPFVTIFLLGLLKLIYSPTGTLADCSWELLS